MQCHPRYIYHRENNMNRRLLFTYLTSTPSSNHPQKLHILFLVPLLLHLPPLHATFPLRIRLQRDLKHTLPLLPLPLKFLCEILLQLRERFRPIAWDFRADIPSEVFRFTVMERWTGRPIKAAISLQMFGIGLASSPPASHFTRLYSGRRDSMIQ